MDKKDDWITFENNKKFYPFNPNPEILDIEDIAGALSLICRYGGRIGLFYSVAQHSCVCHDLSIQEYKYQCLMHDAAEAITGDMNSPIKRHMPDFKELEELVETAIEKNFKIDMNEEAKKYVKHIDLSVLSTEVYSFIPHVEFRAKLTHQPFDIKIKPWSASRAKKEFIKRYEKCNPGRESLWRGASNARATLSGTNVRKNRKTTKA